MRMNMWKAGILRGYSQKANSILFTQKRYKYKKKWAVNLKKKQAVDLALDHFDQFYKPVFGDLWPSIRLALLTQHKYGALINNFASSSDIATDLLSNGAVDICQRVGARFNVKGLQVSKEQSDNFQNGPIEGVGDDPAQKDIHSFVPADPVMSEMEEYMLEEQTKNLEYSLGDGSPYDSIEEKNFDYPYNLKMHCYARGDISMFPSPKRDGSDMLNYYLMDAASILPVLALDIEKDNTVLDLCAAPGGKSLAILQTLMPEKLVCVDKSYTRLKRLREILHFYTPASYLPEEKVEIIIADGQKFDGSRLFDRVLVDAPCTNDRHSLYENENNIFQAGRARERLDITVLQRRLLSAAVKSCKVGGSIVYSTCSLSPAQNDGVIHATLQDFWENSRTDLAIVNTSKMVQSLSHVFKFYAGRFGHLVLPTVQANFGPMYICKIKKIN